MGNFLWGGKHSKEPDLFGKHGNATRRSGESAAADKRLADKEHRRAEAAYRDQQLRAARKLTAQREDEARKAAEKAQKKEAKKEAKKNRGR